jgi:hypothetical protein
MAAEPNWQAVREAARLMDAAPDLYAACEAVVEWWLREGHEQFLGAPAAIFMARAALAKARGEQTNARQR